METTAPLVIRLSLWAAVALAVTASGVVAALPRPIFPVVLLGSVVAFFVAARRPGLAQSIVRGLDLRVAVGLHILRAPIGASFLLAPLPAAFAVPAGYGDIVAGTLAVVALLALPATTRARRVIVAGWNLLAAADILMVIVLAQRLILFGDTPPAFLAFPFPLLPLFVVPLVLITHGIVFLRTR